MRLVLRRSKGQTRLGGGLGNIGIGMGVDDNVLSRSQGQTRLGGVPRFELFAQVLLTGEEAELVKKYRADRECLLEKEVPLLSAQGLLVRAVTIATGGGASGAIKVELTIGSLLTGQTFVCKSIGEVCAYRKRSARGVRSSTDTSWP